MAERIEVAAQISVNDQASQAIANVKSQFQGMEQQARATGRQIQQSLGAQNWRNVATNFGNLGNAFGRLGGTLRRIVNPVAALLGIGTGIGIAEGIKSFQDWAKEAAELPTIAKNLRTTQEALQVFQGAANRAGVDTDSFRQAIARANVRIRQAAEGKLPELAQYLDALFGSRGAWAQGKQPMIDAIELLPKLNANINKQVNPANAAAIAAAVYGRNFNQMLGFVGRSPEEFQKFVDAARASGQITKEQSEIAQAYIDAQTAVGDALRRLALEVFPLIAPEITKMTQSFADFFKDENRRKQLITGLTEAFKALSEMIKNVNWTAVIKALEGIFTWLGKNDNASKTFKTGLLGIAAVNLLPIAKDLAMMGYYALLLGKSIGVALGIGFWPLLLVAAALAGVAWLIYSNWDVLGKYFQTFWTKGLGAAWDEFKTDLFDENSDLRQRIQGIWDGFKGWFVDQLWGDIKKDLNPIFAWLSEKTGGVIPPDIGDAWQEVQRVLGPAWREIKKDWDVTMTPLIAKWQERLAKLEWPKSWDEAKQTASALWQDLKSDWETTIVPMLKRWDEQLEMSEWGPYWVAIRDAVSAAWSEISAAWEKEGITGIMKLAAQKLEPVLGNLWESIRAEWLPSWSTITSTWQSGGMKGLLELFDKALDSGPLGGFWQTIKALWEPVWRDLKASWDLLMGPLIAAWGGFTESWAGRKLGLAGGGGVAAPAPIAPLAPSAYTDPALANILSGGVASALTAANANVPQGEVNTTVAIKLDATGLHTTAEATATGRGVYTEQPNVGASTLAFTSWD